MKEFFDALVLRIYDNSRLLPAGISPKQADYRFAGVVETPYLYVIKIDPLGTSTKPFTTPAMAKDLKVAASWLDESEQIAIDVNRGFVTVQLPKPKERRGGCYTGRNVPRGNGQRVTLGLDVLNEPVYFDFAREMNTNLSFLGVPGSGKSTAMRRVIVSLARNNGPEEVKFLMLECAKDGLDLKMFDHLPPLVHPVITDPNEAANALSWTASQLKGRLSFKLFVVIDETAQLTRQRPDVVTALEQLVSLGRACGVVNLFGTQLADKATLDEAKRIFTQIHNVILGKVSNASLSYLLGNKRQLHADELVGEGDLKISSNDVTTRYTGVWTTRDEIERLPRVETINRLPIEQFTNTAAVIDDLKSVPPPETVTLAVRGAPRGDIPVEVLGEGLISLQRQLDDPAYREQMRGREYYVLPVSRLNELGRNKHIFKTRDQNYIVSLYKYLRKRGVQLCLPGR